MFIFYTRKIISIFVFNFSLFLILMIGIQNSSNQKKVYFLLGETVHLPVSFIIGLSFITGSATASILKMDLEKDNK